MRQTYIEEDHRLATSIEIDDRTPADLYLLPHVSGPDLQALCDEFSGCRREIMPPDVSIVAAGGTALFLARFIASYGDRTKIRVFLEPDSYDRQTVSELRTIDNVEVFSEWESFRNSLNWGFILAPRSDVVRWAHQVFENYGDLAFTIAYDPERLLTKEFGRGRYVFGMSRIWCG